MMRASTRAIDVIDMMPELSTQALPRHARHYRKAIPRPPYYLMAREDLTPAATAQPPGQRSQRVEKGDDMRRVTSLYRKFPPPISRHIDASALRQHARRALLRYNNSYLFLDSRMRCAPDDIEEAGDYCAASTSVNAQAGQSAFTEIRGSPHAFSDFSRH